MEVHVHLIVPGSILFDPTAFYPREEKKPFESRGNQTRACYVASKHFAFREAVDDRRLCYSLF